GVAPKARFASWVVFETNHTTFVNGAALADMFQSHIQEVQVQNHSWVKANQQFTFMTTGESNAIQAAVIQGRAGKGVIIVRAAGNERVGTPDIGAKNANDDAYTADPRAITVGALLID